MVRQVFGIVVGGFIVAGGMQARAARTARHTIEDRVAAIVAKKPQLKGVARSSGGKLRIFVFKNVSVVVAPYDMR